MANEQLLQEKDTKKIITAFDDLMAATLCKPIPHKAACILELRGFTELYIRARSGALSLLSMQVMVIASVAATRPGQGSFGHLLIHLQAHAATHMRIIKVENVLNPRFRAFLLRNDFVFPADGHLCGSGYWAPSGSTTIEALANLPV